jgi:hypothetical protein
MRHIAVKFVPRLLTSDQKQRREKVCLEIREKANEDPTFIRISGIITGDESWNYGYDQETKQQSSQWKSPHHQEQKRHGRDREHVHCFFDVKGIVHREFVPPRTTVNADFYCDILRRLRENVPRKIPEFGAATIGSFITTTSPPTRP